MRLAVRKSEFFLADLDVQFRWYETEASEEVALRYLTAVDRTVNELAERPDLGRPRHFEHPELQGLRSSLAVRPFHLHLIFYRHDETTLDLVRVMHGARDLPRRLRQPPGAEEDDLAPE
ncbi:MAG: type II toxin-antitoxin system RelE/ParE family toxin [Verrucomicrobia bacterium]|nr:type II toxin-antitoxin system RelE/ParE family toxin [Verrucomicrobiota bacterium]